MNQEHFITVLEKRIGMIRKVLGVKAAEYARGGDRLHNFKRGAAMFRETPEAHCLQLCSKHLISLLDMVDDLAKGQTANMGQWEEKVGDAINYLILLEALVSERIHESFDREVQNAPLD